VLVTSGDDFVVTVKLTTPGYDYPIPVDMAFFSSVESDKCYLSEDGITWIPIGKETEIPYDVAIRARIVEGGTALWNTLYGMMLGEDEEEDISLLRSFRDEVLIPHQTANKYVELLYKNSEEFATLFLENPSLTADAGEVVADLLPGIRNILEGGVMRLSAKEISSIESLLIQFEKEASPRLKAAVRKVRRDIRKGNIFKQLGINVNKR